MTVWILEGTITYEGDFFLGVFSSEELAEQYLDKNRKRLGYIDYSIYDVKVDELV
jgi:hypothetical protein